MENCNSLLRKWVLTPLLVSFLVTAALGSDQEPNDNCSMPQNLGVVALPFQFDGSLDATGTGDIDFFQLQLTAGMLVEVQLEGVDSGNGMLERPEFGVFNTACEVWAVAYYQYWNLETPSRAVFQFEVTESDIIIGITSSWDYLFTEGGQGGYRLSIRQIPVAESISGRILDEATGLPLASGRASLTFCDPDCWSPFAWVSADGDGYFYFDSLAVGRRLLTGDYQITAVAEGYQVLVTEAFGVTADESHDVGDLLLAPIRYIGSISGRAVDALNGDPIFSDIQAFVFLNNCPTADRCETTTVGVLDQEGRFLFPGTFLATGDYQVELWVDQYVRTAGPIFSVSEGEHKDVGDVPVPAFPVQFKSFSPCENLPSSGGVCRYSVRVRNGLPGRLDGTVWSIVGTSGGAYASYSQFQVGRKGASAPVPQKLKLKSNEEAEVFFELEVPSTVPDGSSFCVVAQAGENPYAELNPVGQRFLFCVYKDPTGLQVTRDRHRKPGK